MGNMFQKNLLPPSSERKRTWSRKQGVPSKWW